ncbi:MAG: hypothetical protein EPN47_17170 [Acidobacteria bacterium]|nr:MAG: hypothetical protein EPN47_17170 [Acidobacteriota bacterium]
MKKLLTLFAMLAVAFTLSMPAFSQEAPAESTAQSAPAKKEAKKKHSSKKKEKKASKKKKEAAEPQAQ